MSFGWSAGDIVSLAKLSFDIYNFCNSAPEELRSLLHRFHETGEKLQRLARILDASGLGEWTPNPDIRRRLEAAELDLAPLRYVSSKERSLLNKAKGIAHLALSQERLKRIERNLNINDRAIEDIKIDLILACSLRTLQGNTNSSCSSWSSPPAITIASSQYDGLAATTPAGALRLALPSPEHVGGHACTTVDVVNNATRALRLASDARSRYPAGTTSADTHADIDVEVSRSNDILSEIVSLAEGIELYSCEMNPFRNLAQLNEITAMAHSLERLSVCSSGSSTVSQRRSSIPFQSDGASDQTDEDIFSNFSLDETADRRSPVPRRGVNISANVHHPVESDLIVPSRTNILDEALGVSSPSRISPSVHGGQSRRVSSLINTGPATATRSRRGTLLKLSDLVRVSLTSSITDAVACSFSVQTTESSLLLAVCPAKQHLSSTTQRRDSLFSESFRHCIALGSRPIPHFIHPSVEGTMHQPQAPYSLTFTEPQYVAFDDTAQDPQWVDSLTYIFFNENDRRLLSSQLFGKRLLVSCGSNRIIYDGSEVSIMSVIVLWSDEEPGSQCITFTSNINRGTRHKGHRRDLEFKVRGLWNADKSKQKKDSRSITLSVEPVLASYMQGSSGTSASYNVNHDTSAYAFSRRSSSASSGGSLSLFRRFSSTSTSTSPADEKKTLPRRKCEVEFSSLRERTLFLSYIS